MDNDDFRRGKPSNHKVYGEALALLAGDALIAIAIEVFAETAQQVSPHCFQNALGILLNALGPNGVIGGQAAELDLKPDCSPNCSKDELRAIHSKKTGALFEASILIPATLQGLKRSDPDFQLLSRFAASLGLAFQVADDLEDAAKENGAPLSILAHLPSDQAAREALEPLLDALREIETRFEGYTQALTEIVEPLCESLRTYLFTNPKAAARP